LNDMRSRIDAQRAARRRLQGASNVVGLLEVGKDLDAAVVIAFADFGEADLSCRAIEQPRAEPVFERLDMVTHHRRRHVEATSGGREPATIHYPDESRQTGQPVLP